MIISGNDNAVTAMVNDNTVPSGKPLLTRASVIGRTPATFAYSGTPMRTAIGTANAFDGPATLVRKSSGAYP
jgi:hypothetical protein